MHEQSETVQRNGKWVNIYGKKTPKAGLVLPGEEKGYATVEEAVAAARKRSEAHIGDREGGAKGAPVGKKGR